MQIFAISLKSLMRDEDDVHILPAPAVLPPGGDRAEEVAGGRRGATCQSSPPLSRATS